MAQRSAKWSHSLIVLLLCLSISITALITDPVFTYKGLDDQAITTTKQYLSFVLGVAAMPSVFDAAEASHLRDVAWMLRFAMVLAIVSLIVLVVKIDYRTWSTHALRTLALLACAGILANIVPFDALFHYFHVIFFPQGNWQFASDSTLITFYPESFFAWYALWWGVFAAYTAGTIAVLGRIFRS